MIALEGARDRVNGRDGQGLFVIERRQDGRKTSREHRLACSGRADHQHRVRAGGRDFQSAPRSVLAAHLCQIDARCGHGRLWSGHAGGFGQVSPLRHLIDDVHQMAGDARIDALDGRSFGTVGEGDDGAVVSAAASAEQRRQDAANGAQLAGQGQLAEQDGAAERSGVDAAERREHADRDGEIVSATRLAQIRWCEVDRDVPLHQVDVEQA